MIWTLILWIHAGPFSDHDSMALLRVPNFASQGECMHAGQQAVDWTHGTMKVAKFQCVQSVWR